MESVTFGASRTESSSPDETVKSQESVSTDICSKPAESDVNDEKTRHRSHGEYPKNRVTAEGIYSNSRILQDLPGEPAVLQDQLTFCCRA